MYSIALRYYAPFMKLRAALVIAALCAVALSPSNTQAQMQEVIGPMTISMPAGWHRQVRSDGAIAYQATGTDARGEVQFMTVNTPDGDVGSVHNTLWSETKRQLQAHSQESSGRLAQFYWSQVLAFDPSQNRRIWLRLYTASEGTAYMFALLGSEDQTAFTHNIKVLDAVLTKATPASKPSSTPRQSTDPTPIVEALIHVDVRDISFGSNVRTDHILFFGNGVVVRTGVIDGPRECYASLPVTNLASLPHNYGRWRASGGGSQVDIDWQEGPPWKLVRDGERWSLEGKKLLQLRAIDGARFDGTYVYQPMGDAPTTLRLTANGRFEAKNLTESMTCSAGEPHVSQGSGSYEVRKWTLVLTFDDGRGMMLPLNISDDERDLERISAFSIKSYGFARM